ncbi:MAG: hypothetical protein IPP90_20710 [Gemmatimonadaceae bacterium]|nr:hypothetical protein [Gemmatimonadaceae bacterium]
MALLAVGSWSVRGQAADVLGKVFAEATTPDASPAGSASAAVPKPLATVAPDIAPASTLPPDSLMVASSEGALVVSDSIQWVPAVARTWVNVRRDASRIGDVVGVIKPSERAMLGIGRSGWRQVKSPEISGWVDPRLFEADSLRTRG